MDRRIHENYHDGKDIIQEEDTNTQQCKISYL